jgi:hypothetical protein
MNRLARRVTRQPDRPRERDRADRLERDARRAREPAPLARAHPVEPAPSSAQTSVVVSASSIASGIAIVPNTTREREERLADPAQRLGPRSPDPGREQRVVQAEPAVESAMPSCRPSTSRPCASSETSGVPNTSVPSTSPRARRRRHAFTSATPVNSTR